MQLRLADFYKKNLAIIWILFGALLLRIIYLLIYSSMPDWNMLTVDNYYHFNWAKDIASGNIFGDTTYFRAPFYIFCLALVFSLFGATLAAARIFGLVIGLVSLLLTFLTGKKLFGKRIGLMAAAIQSLYPIILYFESELLLDPLFMLLLQLSVYSFVLWYKEQTLSSLICMAVSLGLASITRPTALLFLPLVIIFLYFSSTLWRQRVKLIASFTLLLALIILPITIRNYVAGGEAVLISSQGGINFYIGNNRQSDGVTAAMPEPLGHNWKIDDIRYLTESETTGELKSGALSDYWYNKTFDEILQSPLPWAGLFLKKLYYNFSNREISNNRNLNYFFSQHSLLKFSYFPFAALLALSVLAVVTGYKSHWGVRLLFILIFFYSVAVALFFFSSRFRLPLLPFYIILSAVGIESLLRLSKQSYRRYLLPVSLAVLAAIFSVAPIAPLPTGRQVQHWLSLGLFHFANGNTDSAIGYFHKAAKIDSTFPELNLNIGACHLQLKKLDSSVFYFEKEIKAHPKRALGHSNLAGINLVQEEWDKAFSNATKAIGLKPYRSNAHTIRLRAAANIAGINSDSLVNIANYASERTNQDRNVLYNAAVILTQRNALDQAISFLKRALSSKSVPIEIDDEAFTPYYDETKAARLSKRALVNYQLGYVYGIKNEYGNSIRYSIEAISIDPNLESAYANLAAGYYAQGKFKAVDSVIAEAKKLFPASQIFERP
ncbi:MAG: glycosyltransferase family 39 protein [candidate division Zixibacteria bacterium]